MSRFSHHRWGMRRTTRRQLLAGAAAALAPIGIGSAWPARYRGRLYPGVAVLGLDLGGLTRAEAATRLEQSLAPFLAQPVAFQLGERTWTPSASDIGLRVDLHATLNHACRHGRGAGFLRRYATLLDPEDARTGVPVVVEIDSATLDAFFGRLDEEIGREPRDARLLTDDLNPRILPERAGRRLDVPVMREAVLSAAATLTTTWIPVATRRLEPRVAASDLAESHLVASTLISAPIVIHGDDRAWTLSIEDLAAVLEMPDDPARRTPRLDQDRLVKRLAPIAEEVDRAPRDARVAWNDGLYATRASIAGVEVDLEALAADVAAAALTAERSVALPLRPVPPAVDSDRLEALGITRRLASGSSSFAGSSDARATNVRVAAEHVSQALVPPGGVFSFNDALGPISEEQGYVQGKIISGNWYADDLGGGVCQVSTTVYRAALLAGLPFPEWHPHTFRLSFYELDGWPPGMDAAIYQPNTPDEWELDLHIANPTDSWLLLQMRLDGDTVTAEFYGGVTNYDVTISDPVLGEPIPPPEPVERPSPDLPPGTREQAQVAQPGLEVILTRTVRLNGEVIADDTFVSRYEPQPELWLVGTGEA